MHTLKTFARNLNLTYCVQRHKKYWTRFFDVILLWKHLPTGFLGMYEPTTRNLKWPPKSGIIWSRWPLGLKMLFPALEMLLSSYFDNWHVIKLRSYLWLTFKAMTDREKMRGIQKYKIWISLEQKELSGQNKKTFVIAFKGSFGKEW